MYLMDTRAVLGMAEMLGRKDAAAERKLRFNAVNTAMLHGPQSGWACFCLFEDDFVLVAHILLDSGKTATETATAFSYQLFR